MTSKGIAAEKNDVKCQHDRSDANTEGDIRRGRVSKPERLPDIVRENTRKISAKYMK